MSERVHLYKTDAGAKTSGVLWLSAVILFAMAFLAAPAKADQNDPQLDELFTALKVSASEKEASVLEDKIWQIWHRSESATVELLMSHVLKAMSANDYGKALLVVTDIIELAPDFAEAWNKRATIFYLLGQYGDSLHDIAETLKREPRHFGALAGRGLIGLATDDDEGALAAFEQALMLHPHLKNPKMQVERLNKKLGGRRI